MLNSSYTEKLLGLQGVEVKNIHEKEECYENSIEQPRNTYNCPRCGEITHRIHDYHYQRVKEMPAFEKNVFLILRKRRYVCSCGKRFAEPNTFLAKYQIITKREIMGILEKLSDSRSYTSVAREFNISTSTLFDFLRIYNTVNQQSSPMLLG